ncbi:hypothetical protein RJ640_019213 [Escallonia rubra]|uniref:GPI mannosyltransferase 2 n=1 Tax=Escallonia rubra TaxID=112253 RepID=A0AA88UBF0_9ASTE|nr:hypothetical protein RJ640_019213 [Escallonia rubra]
MNQMRRESAMKTQPEIRHSRTVLRSAIASRLLLIVLILLWRSLLTPYDTSASINPSCLTTDPAAAADRHRILFPRIAAAIEDSIVWDSVYFVRIAQCGYEYEQSYAFLPLLPACISLLSRTVFAPLIPLVGRRAVLGISGYAINNIAFAFAALYLHRQVSVWSSIWAFIYTESLFALLSIGGVYHLMLGANNIAIVFLALSGSASILSGRGVGFLRYFELKQLPNFLLAFPILSLALCSIINYVKLQPDVFFSLGFRASALDQSVAAVKDQYTRTKSAYFSDKEASKVREDDQTRMRKPTIKREVSTLLPSAIGASEKPRYLPVTVLPFVLHLGFMVATAFFVMHVQVSTRFLSANPPLYWFASYLMASPSASKRWGYLIWAYCAAYILLGSLLFSNFYPFT